MYTNTHTRDSKMFIFGIKVKHLWTKYTFLNFQKNKVFTFAMKFDTNRIKRCLLIALLIGLAREESYLPVKGNWD